MKRETGNFSGWIAGVAAPLALVALVFLSGCSDSKSHGEADMGDMSAAPIDAGPCLNVIIPDASIDGSFSFGATCAASCPANYTASCANVDGGLECQTVCVGQ